MESFIFKSCSEENLTIETYMPVKPNGKGVVCYYGGGWMNDNRSRFRDFAGDLTEAGYLVFLPQYRVYNLHRVQPKEELEDVVDGIGFIYEHLLEKYGLCKQQVSWIGASAGGHLILCAALLEPYQSRLSIPPEKIVLFNPVCRPDSLKEWLKTKTGSYFDFSGICPLQDLKKAGPDILAMHGIEDDLAPYKDLEGFARRYKALGGICEVKGYEGRNHGFWRQNEGDYRDTFMRMLRFLDDTVLEK